MFCDTNEFSTATVASEVVFMFVDEMKIPILQNNFNLTNSFAGCAEKRKSE